MNKTKQLPWILYDSFFLNLDIPFKRIDTVSPNKILRYSHVWIFSYTPIFSYDCVSWAEKELLCIIVFWTENSKLLVTFLYEQTVERKLGVICLFIYFFCWKTSDMNREVHDLHWWMFIKLGLEHGHLCCLKLVPKVGGKTFFVTIKVNLFLFFINQ